MGKGKKSIQTSWLIFLEGLGLSLAIYILGQLLTAFLVVRGTLPEERLFPMVAVACLLSSFAGGFLCARRSPWGALPGAMLSAVLFTVILVVIGILAWGASWTNTSLILLLCALGGGVLAGFLNVRRNRHGKRSRKLRTL